MPYVWQNKTWPCFTWQSDPLVKPLGETRLLQGKIMTQAKMLGFELGREAQANLITEEAVKTAAIEGETLNPVLVRSSVAKQLGLPMAGLPAPERSVDGLVEVLINATSHYHKPLTLKRIKGWHAALFPTGYSGMHKIRVGRWRHDDPMRVVSGPIGHEVVHFEAPPSKNVETEMTTFLQWWNQSLKEKRVEGVLRAGIAHFYFVTIHPFEDGNGRIARALTDMALAQDEKMATRFYSLSSQIMADRDDYYRILEKTQRGNGDITEWLAWFIACLEKAMNRSQEIINRTLTKARFWQRHAQTPFNDRQRKVVNRLIDAGPEGFQGGLTTRKYVAMTKASRATAYREIDDLVAKKILLPNQAGGRSTSYQVVLDF